MLRRGIAQLDDPTTSIEHVQPLRGHIGLPGHDALPVLGDMRAHPDRTVQPFHEAGGKSGGNVLHDEHRQGEIRGQGPEKLLDGRWPARGGTQGHDADLPSGPALGGNGFVLHRAAPWRAQTAHGHRGGLRPDLLPGQADPLPHPGEIQDVARHRRPPCARRCGMALAK